MLIESSVSTPWGSTSYVGSEAINISTSGGVAIVSGSAGYFIVVMGYLVIAEDTVELAFENETGSVVSGPYVLAANGGNIVTPVGIGQFVCKKDEDLILDLSSNVQVGGHIVYGLIRGGV